VYEAAVSVNVAVAVFEFDPPPVNVVVPQPLEVVTVDGVFTMMKVGSTNAITSPTSRTVFSLNVYFTAVGRSVYGSAMISLLSPNAVVAVAVDFTIDTAAMFATAASFSVTAAVLVFRFAPCAFAAVVTPVAIVTLHSWYAGRIAVVADSVSFAPAAPEFALATVKAVLPQPLRDGVATVPNTNVGNTNSMVSGVEISRGEFSAKMKVIDDLAAVTGLAMTSLLCWNPDVGAVTAVDGLMDPVAAAMLAADASVTATVRVFRLALCAFTLAEIPVFTVTEH